MGIPYIFILFLIFIGWFSYKRYNAIREEKEKRDLFWQKEEEANATRRQDISNLPYIRIPVDTLPFNVSSSLEIKEQETILMDFVDKQILNLTGISNTDLKLMYGAANLPFLMECDERFTTLCQALHTWGELLYEQGDITSARKVLEFGIASGSDISKSYLLLAAIYQEQKDQYLIPNLIHQAEQLNSLSKETIILKLSEFVHN